MSEAEATRFIEALTTDTQLREKLESLQENPKLVFAEVEKSGFKCSPEEIKFAMLESMRDVLSEKDLNNIAAGVQLNTSDKIVIGATAGTIGGIAVIATASAAAAAA